MVRLYVLTQAGMNKDSDGLKKECRKEPGFHRNLNVRRMQFMLKRIRLKRRMMTPIIRSQSDR